MSLDYRAIQLRVDRALQQTGLRISVTRGDESVGKGWAVFVAKSEADAESPGSAQMAQTATTTRQVLVSGLMRAPQTGDVVSADKESWRVLMVEAVRPTTTTLIYKCEVSA